MADPNEFDHVMPDLPENEEIRPPAVIENFGMRLINMIIIWIMLSLAQTVLSILTLVQLVLTYLNGRRPNERLAEVGTDLGIWIAKAARYQTMADNTKPWPWTELD